MSPRPLEELTKEELIRIVQGEKIDKVALERIERQKIEGLDVKSRWNTLKKINKAFNFPGPLSWTNIFPAIIIGGIFSYMRSYKPDSDVEDPSFIIFVVLMAMYIMVVDSMTNFKVNQTNARLEALTELLRKSDVIKD